MRTRHTPPVAAAEKSVLRKPRDDLYIRGIRLKGRRELFFVSISRLRVCMCRVHYWFLIVQFCGLRARALRFGRGCRGWARRYAS